MALTQSLTLDQWLSKAGYTPEWYDSLDPMFKAQVAGVYQSGDQSTVPTFALNALKRIAALAEESNSKPTATATAAKQEVSTQLTTAGENVGLSPNETAALQTDPKQTLQDLVDQHIIDSTTAQNLLGAGGSLLNDPSKLQVYVDAVKKQHMLQLIGGSVPDLLNLQVMTGSSVTPGPDTLPQNVSLATKRIIAAQMNSSSGQQWASVSDLMSDPAQYILGALPGQGTSDDMKQIQQQLFDAGYDVTVTGLEDDKTRAALLNAAQDAIANHTTIPELLIQKSDAQRQQLLGQRAATQNPFVAPAQKLADPAEVMQQANTDAQNQLGRNLTPSELKVMEATYRAFEAKNYAGQVQEAKYQNTATNAGNVYQFDQAHQKEEAVVGVTPESKPNMPAPPTIQQYNPQADVAAAERGAAPTDASAEQLRGAFEGFVKAIRGWA